MPPEDSPERVLPLTREWIEILKMVLMKNFLTVLPLTREWIEMHAVVLQPDTVDVLPLTREWIEILEDMHL